MNDFLDFVGKIAVMKPAHIDDDKPAQVKRLESLLLSKDYLADEKIDGCHYLTFSHRFFSTEGVEKTHNYPHIRDFFKSLQMPNLILDGEIFYPGKTSQFCTRVTGSSPDVAIAFQNDYSPIHYVIWDILRTPKGTWLLNEPQWKRRKILEEFYNRFIAGTQIADYVHLINYTVDNKKEFYKDLIAEGKEGIVLKSLSGFYIMGKKPMWQWMKLKQKDTADFFITGYKPAEVEYTGKNIETWPFWKEVNGVIRPVTKNYYNNWIGALELSAFVNGEVRVICYCSGFTEELRADFSVNMNKYINRAVKISFMEKTEAGIPRHPRFEQFHESKTASECTWELYE